MKSPKTIREGSLLHRLLVLWIKAGLYSYYKQIQLEGRHHIPEGVPVIYAVNHQNAFMDPLVVGAFIDKIPTFLTRASVFKHPFIARLLIYFRLLPVYRPRDGWETVKNNEDTFALCRERLRAGGCMMIFPEGNHNRIRSLRPLRKGLARIALSVYEQDSHSLPIDVHIVPVGIHYTDHLKFRSRLLVVWGPPLRLEDILTECPLSYAQTLKRITQASQQALQACMLHIAPVSHYPELETLRSLAQQAPRYQDLYQELQADQQLMDTWGPKLADESSESQEVQQALQMYAQKRNKLKLRDHVLLDAPYKVRVLALYTMGLFFSFPLFLFGLITNYLPYRIPHILALKVFQDEHFYSPFKMAMGMVIFPMYYVLVAILVGILTQSWLWAISSVGILFFSGHFAIRYSEWAKKVWARWRYVRLLRREDPTLTRLIQLRDFILKATL